MSSRASSEQDCESATRLPGDRLQPATANATDYHHHYCRRACGYARITNTTITIRVTVSDQETMLIPQTRALTLTPKFYLPVAERGAAAPAGPFLDRIR